MPLPPDRTRFRTLLRVVFLLVAPAVCLMSLAWLRSTQAGYGEPSLYWDDAVRREVQAIVERRYVDPIDADEERRLFDESLRAYVGSLDPFSRYFTPEERQALDQETTGAFGGIGIIFQSGARAGLWVTSVREDGPADRAGIRPGEFLESIGGRPLAGHDRDVLGSWIKGPVGTRVSFVVRGIDGSARTVEVVRAQVALDTVPAVRLVPGLPPVGYVRIEQFADTTAGDAREAVEALLGAGAKAVVLDLRRNLGGVVRAAESVAGLFLPKDTVVCVTRRRDGGEPHVTSGFFDAGQHVPLVVLVDESTASASEILAGALQDHGRAVLVGERTFGKFLVQTQVETSRAGAVVRLTTSRYETPRGRSSQRDETRGISGGLVPDVRVTMGEDDERALTETFALQNGPHWRGLPRGEMAERVDPQLDAALALLRGGRPPAEPVPRRP